MSFSRPALFALALLPAPALAQAQEFYYVASRNSQDVQKVNACGVVVRNIKLGSAPSAAYPAPDGKVWVALFVQTSFLLMDGDGGNRKTVNTKNGDSPVDIAFDARGNGLVLASGRLSSAGSVYVYDKDGKLQKTYALTKSWPLRMALDQNGDIWVGHRIGPPTIVTRIDVKTGKATTFTAPASTGTKGGNIAIDLPSVAQKGNVWIVGDGSNELLELNPHMTPAKWSVHVPNAVTQTYGALAVDRKNKLWLSDWASGRLVHWQISTKKTLKTIMLPRPTGIAIDGRGRVLVTNTSLSPSALDRYDPGTYVLEQRTRTGNRASGPKSNFQFARQNQVLGDSDGDGDRDISELTAGTSLFDAQSNSRVDLHVVGSNKRGGTVDVKLGGTSRFVLGIGLKRLPNPVGLPAWKGALRIDPAALGIVLGGTAPRELKGLRLPGGASSIGLEVYLQAIYQHAAARPPEWSNDACVKVY